MSASVYKIYAHDTLLRPWLDFNQCLQNPGAWLPRDDKPHTDKWLMCVLSLCSVAWMTLGTVIGWSWKYDTVPSAIMTTMKTTINPRKTFITTCATCSAACDTAMCHCPVMLMRERCAKVLAPAALGTGVAARSNGTAVCGQ